MPGQLRSLLERAIADTGGILRLEPAWVARDILPPGRRLGLPEDRYDLGARGAICERWLASTTLADNHVGPPDEGLSHLAIEGTRVTLRDAIAATRSLLLGDEYAATHQSLGCLAKIFDYGGRLPYHLHPRSQHAALVGRKSKDEAYYFPEGAYLGSHPESFFGVHPWIVEAGAHDVLLPYLESWDSDEILKFARGYVQVPQEGFFIPSGVLHAPGSALTIELQEDSDVAVILQARNAGRIVPKDVLFKDVRPEDRERDGERFILELIDWEANGDPFFYENHHLTPVPIATDVPGLDASWICHGTPKFSGKKLVLGQGCRYVSIERGIHSVLAWRGTGSVGGLAVVGGDPSQDELLVSHDAAVWGVEIANTGGGDLTLFKFFGPDVNPDAPGASGSAGVCASAGVRAGDTGTSGSRARGARGCRPPAGASTARRRPR